MNRAGEYVQVLTGDAKYFAYKPNPLPPYPEIEMDEEMLPLLSNSYRLLGKLDSVSSLIPDVDLFVGSYVRKEALLSSQIEGTQATLEDILDSNVVSSKDLDVDEVINYVNAMNFAINNMKKLPICSRLLCNIHKVLLSGVRGEEKNPGEFRKSQNWIGASNSSLKKAKYIPPTVDDMKIAMSNLEKYVNESEMDTLLKVALTHYQFETIHPFLDGNGRIGRLLIILMLLDSKILNKPVLYLSLYLKTNRIEYYDRMSEVRLKGNYEQWIKFFLQGIIETSNDSIETILKIDELLKTDGLKLNLKNKSTNLVFNYLKEHPIVEIKTISDQLKLSYNTVSKIINKMIELNILKTNSTKSRDRIFEYKEYINILKAGT